MTLVLALRSREGVVLASDSQRTEGAQREPAPKLFISPTGIVWGTAGNIAIQQEVYAELHEMNLAKNPTRRDGRDAAVQAIKDAVEGARQRISDPTPAALAVEGLFAWYSESESRTFLLWVRADGASQFYPTYHAVGGPGSLARYALSRGENLEYDTMPFAAAQMVAFDAADSVIRNVSQGVDLPVQVATVTASGADLLSANAVRALEDTAGAFRDAQRSFLNPTEASTATDTGLRPQ